MVKRSSIDPIEEARARVRLRYMRGRQEARHLKPIGLKIDRITRKAGAKKLPPLKLLQSRWRDIAGEKLFQFCRPERLSGGKDGRVLTLKVLPQAAPLIQHQSETIRQRVSVAAGGDITAIKLVQGALSGPAAPAQKRRIQPLSAKQRAELTASLRGVEDAKLREALFALGAAMLTQEDSPPQETESDDLPF